MTDQSRGASPTVTPVSVTSTGTVVPGSTTPRSHWREAASQVPPGGVIPVIRTPAGGATVSRVPGEAAGPLLTTSTVTVAEPPTVTSGVVPGARRARSTDCWTVGSFWRPASPAVSGVTAPEPTSRTFSFSGLLTAAPARELNTRRLPSAVQAASRGWCGPVTAVSGRSRPQAPAWSRAAAGSRTRQASPETDVRRRPFRSSIRPPPFLRLKATARPSGEKAGLSSMTAQAPGSSRRSGRAVGSGR